MTTSTPTITQLEAADKLAVNILNAAVLSWNSAELSQSLGSGGKTSRSVAHRHLEAVKRDQRKEIYKLDSQDHWANGVAQVFFKRPGRWTVTAYQRGRRLYTAYLSAKRDGTGIRSRLKNDGLKESLRWARQGLREPNERDARRQYESYRRALVKMSRRGLGDLTEKRIAELVKAHPDVRKAAEQTSVRRGRGGGGWLPGTPPVSRPSSPSPSR